MEPPGRAHSPLCGGSARLIKEYFELVVADRENHNVSGDGRVRISVGNSHVSPSCETDTIHSVENTPSQAGD